MHNNMNLKKAWFSQTPLMYLRVWLTLCQIFGGWPNQCKQTSEHSEGRVGVNINLQQEEEGTDLQFQSSVRALIFTRICSTILLLATFSFSVFLVVTACQQGTHITSTEKFANEALSLVHSITLSGLILFTTTKAKTLQEIVKVTLLLYRKDLVEKWDPLRTPWTLALLLTIVLLVLEAGLAVYIFVELSAVFLKQSSSTKYLFVMLVWHHCLVILSCLYEIFLCGLACCTAMTLALSFKKMLNNLARYDTLESNTPYAALYSNVNQHLGLFPAHMKTVQFDSETTHKSQDDITICRRKIRRKSESDLDPLICSSLGCTKHHTNCSGSYTECVNNWADGLFIPQLVGVPQWVDLTAIIDHLFRYQKLMVRYFWLPIAVVSVQVVSTTIGTLFFIRSNDVTGKELIISMGKIILMMLPLICLHHGADYVGEQRDNLKRCLARIQLVSPSPAICQEARRLLLYLQQFPQYSAGNFFELSKAQLVRMGGFIATYVVILLQFNGKTEPILDRLARTNGSAETVFS